MISEIANTLFLTYLASEYSISKDDHVIFSGGTSSRTHGGVGGGSSRQQKTKIIGLTTIFIVLLNILDRYYVGVSEGVMSKHIVETLGHYVYIVRFVLAATSYVITLFVDINRRYFFYYLNSSSNLSSSNNNNKNNTSIDHDDDRDSSTSKHSRHRRPKLIMPWSAFLPRVGRAFCKVLPAYPFLAVLVSFVFLFVIQLWEFLGLSEEWLQWPIYYGTLYGPFIYVYVTVKHQILCMEGYALPT